MSESDYKRGQKHGNESRFAEPVGFIDLLGGKDYVAGKQNSYDRRVAEAGGHFLGGSTERKDWNSGGTSSDSNNSTSYSDSSYSSSSSSYSSSDGIGIGGWIFLIIAGLIVLSIIGALIDHVASVNYNTPTKDIHKLEKEIKAEPEKKVVKKEYKQHRRNGNIEQRHMNEKEDPDYFDPSGL